MPGLGDACRIQAAEGSRQSLICLEPPDYGAFGIAELSTDIDNCFQDWLQVVRASGR